MYWLLDIEEQEKVREKIENIEKILSIYSPKRDQTEQVFPFNGRKDRTIAGLIISSLTEGNSNTICDPFVGSGTFAYSALDHGCNVLANEWEPFAHRMLSAPFSTTPSSEHISQALKTIDDKVASKMFNLYKTRCPRCGKELMFESIFYDRVPLEYFHPQNHPRLGKDGENVIFRQQKETKNPLGLLNNNSYLTVTDCGSDLFTCTSCPFWIM